ncbi:MAG: hypothetical protein JJU11_00325, partial [Candidatus Sumerlaeia bacterium]|nr:hypothetical protein [Candidatus Sumerlaeia bacterium]
MPTRQRLFAAFLFLSVLIVGNVMEVVALGASLWLSRAVATEVAPGWSCSQGECRSANCRCAPGKCRGGEHCGCGHKTPDRKIAIQRFRIPCHEPPPPVGLYEPPPRQKHLLTTNSVQLPTDLTALLPWRGVYRFGVRDYIV